MKKKEMSTASPETIKNATFYILCPEDLISEIHPESVPITFSLPAGTKFPDDLTPIMNKTKRYFKFKESLVYGRTSPTCGDDCDCTNCSSLVQECEGEECKGFVSSIEKIQCQRDGCVKSNETTYNMFPLYPINSSLPYYNPKFKFIKIFPSQTIPNTPQNISIVKELEPQVSTLPPEYNEIPSMVLFGVSYPSLEIFDTEDKFNEILILCKTSSVLLYLLKEDQYAKHNNEILQQIIKINQLPSTLIKQDIFSIANKNFSTVNQREQEWRMQLKVKTIPPYRNLDKSYEKLVQAYFQKQSDYQNQSANLSFSNPLEFSVKEPTEPEVKEGYDDLPIRNLVVPISSQDDDDIKDLSNTSSPPNKTSTSFSSSTPPNKTSTSSSSSTKKISGWKIFGIVIVIIVLLVVTFLYFKKSKK